MIKRSTRARLGHLSLILLGLAGGLAYLGAITRPATVGAVPIQQTDPQIGFTSTSFTVVENQGPAVIQVQNVANFVLNYESETLCAAPVVTRCV